MLQEYFTQKYAALFFNICVTQVDSPFQWFILTKIEFGYLHEMEKVVVISWLGKLSWSAEPPLYDHCLKFASHPSARLKLREQLIMAIGHGQYVWQPWNTSEDQASETETGNGHGIWDPGYGLWIWDRGSATGPHASCVTAIKITACCKQPIDVLFGRPLMLLLGKSFDSCVEA